MQLRPYQQEAREAVQAEWAKGRKRTLLVLPTGCGKTIVFSKIIEDQVKEGKRVLVLAHRSELLEQASDCDRSWHSLRESRKYLYRFLVSGRCRFSSDHAEREAT